MAVVIPLNGCLYNPEVVKDMGKVLCPPYDMIGSDLHQELKSLSDYNVVHLEGGEQPDPETMEIDYRKASDLFQHWLKENILAIDSSPCFYLMQHGFEYRGEKLSQFGLFANVGLEDYESRIVFPHEFTREPAVQDRVALLEHSRAQFSPIMTNYRDSEQKLRDLYEHVTTTSPVFEVNDGVDGDIRLWRISEPTIQNRIIAFFQDVPLYLADGHHRYEAALRYQRLRQGASDYTKGEGCDFVMMALVEFDDPGLLLLPYHRNISGLSESQVREVREVLDELFEIQIVDLKGTTVDDLLDRVAFLGSDRHALAMIGPGPNEAYLLMLRPGVNWQEWGDLAVSEAWILEQKVLRPIVGDDLNTYVHYGHDPEECVGQVVSGGEQLAFLLKPFPMDAFEKIVGGGQRLPSKSTFFYPKLPTGLVIHQISSGQG